MDIFGVLTFLGGISLFLFGMNIMSKALEKRAGNGLKKIINRMTSNKYLGILTGLVVTAIIQSSSATTVMVVGFVNSNIMSLNQAINVIMGANIGTTITSWILSLSGINSTNIFVQLLKPSAFSPILALIGVVLYMFVKEDKKKDSGLILLGFATLMFGMETMSNAVSVLKDVSWFRNLFIVFENNPVLGVLVGALVTALIQSSSASVGILQAFATTGQISFGSAIPIILGQNIGTCITAMISSLGTNRNAKRASLIHLFFNVIGTVVVLAVYLVISLIFKPLILSTPATLLGIAIIHTAFNLICLVLLMPFSKMLSKLVCLILRDKESDVVSEIDERFLNTPSLALDQVNGKLMEMANDTKNALNGSIDYYKNNVNDIMVYEAEDKTDHFEDLIGSYLVKLSAKSLNQYDSKLASLYFKIIGDLERIADHSLNIVKVKEESNQKDIILSIKANAEIDVCFKALNDIWNLTYNALKDNSYAEAKKIEPLEQVIDLLVKNVRNNHIVRMQNNECTMDKGFILADLLSNIERISDHCSNIAGYIIDGYINNLESHKNLSLYRHNEEFKEMYDDLLKRYGLEN